MSSENNRSGSEINKQVKKEQVYKPVRSKTDANDKVVFYEHTAERKPTVQSSRPAEPVMTEPVRKKSKKPNKLSKKRVVLNVLASVFSALFIVAGVVCLIAYTYFHRVNFEAISETSESTSRPSETVFPEKEKETSGNVKVKTYTGNLLEDPMVLNIMLFGADTRAGSDTGNSDTMVLFSIDTRHRKMKMLSFMRDTYVEIPGYGDNRLNASYTLGGASLSVSTIQKNYGIKIDRYAVVDFSSFKNIIDILGGIDLQLTEEEVDYINWQTWINAQDEYKQAEGDYKEAVRSDLRQVWLSSVPESEKPINKNELIFTSDGENDPTALVHLNGRQALWQARNRGEDGICSGDDFTRTQRQRNVIGTIINDMRKADISKVMSIIYEIGPLITTNVKTSEITSLAANIRSYLSYDIVSDSAPRPSELGTVYSFSDPYDRPVYIDGYLASVILINDWDQFRQSVAEFIFEEQVRKEQISE